MKSPGPMGEPILRLVEVHHRHQRVGVVGSLSEKCPRGQLVKSHMEHCQCKGVARPPSPRQRETTGGMEVTGLTRTNTPNRP